MSRNSRLDTRRKTRRMVLCAILAALSVVALGLGALLQIADLTAAALAGMIILLVTLCYGPRYALLTFAVTSTLSLVLMPQSLASWTYVLLMGYYPILYTHFARLPRVLGWLIKLLLLVVVSAICLFVFHFLIFGGEGSLWTTFVTLFGAGSTGPILIAGTVALELLTYILYDILLGRIVLIYPFRLKRMVDKWMKP